MARRIPEEREGQKLEKVPQRLKTAGNLLKIRGGFGIKKTPEIVPEFQRGLHFQVNHVKFLGGYDNLDSIPHKLFVFVGKVMPGACQVHICMLSQYACSPSRKQRKASKFRGTKFMGI